MQKEKQENNKVLYLSYDGMTDPLGQSQVLPYLCGLTKLGYQFTLISFEKKERYNANKLIIEEICKKNGIEWHPLSYTKKPPVLSTLVDVFQMQRLSFRLQKQKKFSIVHCRSYITALVGQKLKKKYGAKFLFDMRGLWADERVDGGLWPQTKYLYKKIFSFFKKKELLFLKSADHIISLTFNAKNEIKSWSALQSYDIPITVIPCCVDTAHFNPENISSIEVANLKNTLKMNSSQKIIAYYGSIGTWYLLKEMLDFFKQLLQNNSDTLFLFVTPDSPDLIYNTSRSLNIADSCLRITSATRSEMPAHIAICDYSIFFIKPSYSKKASSPTKQGEIMAMGKPVICNSNVGDTDFIVHQYQSGIVVNNLNPEAYQQAIAVIAEKKNAFDSTHIRQGANHVFSLEEGIQHYANVYKIISE